MNKKSLRTPDDAVTYLGLDRQGLGQPLEALRWLCRTGQLKYTKIGRRIRFREEWLDDLIERNAVHRGKLGGRSTSE